MSLLTGQGNGGGGFSSKMVDAQGQPVKMWNYTIQADENGVARQDFCQTITGTVVDMDEVQATKYQSTELEWWDEACTKPKMDIEIVINRDDTGEDVCGHIKPGSSVNYDKFSVARKACIDAIRAITGDTETKDITKLIGYNVTVSTQDLLAANGQVIKYSSGNPRPGNVVINGEGKKNLCRFGKPKPQPQSQVVPQPQPQAAQAPAPAPQAQPAQVAQPAQAAAPAQPANQAQAAAMQAQQAAQAQPASAQAAQQQAQAQPAPAQADGYGEPIPF